MEKIGGEGGGGGGSLYLGMGVAPGSGFLLPTSNMGSSPIGEASESDLMAVGPLPALLGCTTPKRVSARMLIL